MKPEMTESWRLWINAGYVIQPIECVLLNFAQDARARENHDVLVDQLSRIQIKEKQEHEGEKWNKATSHKQFESDDEEDDWDIAGELNGKDRPATDDVDARFADADEDEERPTRRKTSKKRKEEIDLREYEVGEYGFPLDGYDYSKHFKVMGGQGAVFMQAESEKKDSGYYKKVPSCRAHSACTVPDSSFLINN